ncbi:DUF2851 family protein [uncultured Alistipes sp.]|uniref:DUF2851 family protein n=1 Tax=uncultured Alistipes sp. TaxID=538949 RepID=UPI00262F9288|nr:DUF2851 family protein [uncultured Alistipes sp.]
MPSIPSESFLRLVWTQNLYTSLEGENVAVVSPGKPNPALGIDVLDASVEVNGVLLRGPVAIHRKASDWHEHLHHVDPAYDGCVLHAVAENDAVICRTDGKVVPAVRMIYPQALEDRYAELVAGSDSYRCGTELAREPRVKLCGLLTELTVERLERKYDDFLMLYREANNNWNEAFYITLFKTMGMGSNAEPYMKLARRVSFVNVCKVRESTQAVEALLLGAAGLLMHVDPPDEYTFALQREFRHQSRRFDIVPMRGAEWNLRRHNPHNHPVVRIAELAALLASQDFMFSKLLACRTPEEVRGILSVSASEYWTTHSRLGVKGPYSVKSFGEMMLDNLCINLVAPMMFTYGKVSGEEQLKETAIEMLERTGAENNIYIRGWRSRGIEIENAFFSQGLLQLSKTYCDKKRCAECIIGRKALCSR